MNINGVDYFMGAYRQRISDNNTIRPFDTNRNEKITKAFEEIGFHVDSEGSFSWSDEAKLLLKQAGADKMQNDVAELYQKDAAARAEFGGDDEFAVNGNDQWIVFSKYLYEQGFYDSMSDEDLKNTEQILMRITDGMDDVFSWEHGVGIDLYDEFHGEQLDSHEARLELESSAAALKYFSDNLLGDADKAGFDALIDRYYAHNSAILDNGYASIEEKFNSSLSRISNVVRERYPGLEVSRDWTIRGFLGGITHSEEETGTYIDTISDLFAQMKQENKDYILDQMRNAFLAFVTNGSDNEEVNEHVAAYADDVFSHIDDYWTGVLEINHA